MPLAEVTHRGAMIFDATMPNLFEEVHQYLEQAQQELVARSVERGVIIAGNFVVRDANGPLDSFAVRIEVPKEFPTSSPVVYETGSRIPRLADRHIDNAEGKCCVCVWEAWCILEQPVTFAKFMDGPVSDFFFGQSFFESEGEWPFGELSHGWPGIVEAFANVFDSEPSEQIVLRHLKFLSRRRFRSHHPCPCGSKRPVGDCHSDKMLRLSRLVSPVYAAKLHSRLKRLASTRRS